MLGSEREGADVCYNKWVCEVTLCTNLRIMQGFMM